MAMGAETAALETGTEMARGAEAGALETGAEDTGGTMGDFEDGYVRRVEAEASCERFALDTWTAAELEGWLGCFAEELFGLLASAEP